MSATIYRSFEVYTAPPACLIRGDSVFSNHNNFLIAFAEVSNSSGLNHSFEWRIEFVGSLRNFSLLYCSHLSNAIQDGLVYTSMVARSADIYGVLGEKVQRALPLTASAMRSHGQTCYCWSADQFSQLRGEHDLVEVEHRGSTRYAAPVRTEDDVRALFQQAIQVAEGFSVEGAPGLWYSKSTPWKCHESALSPAQASA